MDKVKKLVKAGSSIPGAIRECLAQSVRATALKHGRNYNTFSAVITGKRAPITADIEALISELGGTDQEWRELLHEAGRPISKVG